MIIKAALKFARLRIVVSCYALAFLGNAAAGGEFNFKMFIVLFLISAVTVHANSINDYADREIDRVNLKYATDRPLVTRDISQHEFWAIHLASGGFALLLSLLYGKTAFMLTFTVLIIDYAYSLKPFRLSYHPVLSPIILSAAYVYYSFSLGYLCGDTNTGYPWQLSFGLFLGFVARMLLKDFRDAKGDKKHGKNTFLLCYGARNTCIASGIFWLLAVLAIIRATDLALGLALPLIIGVASLFSMLWTLSNTKSPREQQFVVALIAKSGNISIVTILAYLLCLNQINLSTKEIQLITFVIGTSLIMYNWLSFLSRKRAA